MGKGREYTKHQQGIIRRFYEHRDSTLLTRLAELTSDLAMVPEEKKATTLWKRTAEALAKAGANPAQAERIVAGRDIKALAALVGELSR